MTANFENWIKNKYRSNGEKIIANMLDQYRISFVYEPDIYLKEGNKRYIWHPDFYLPEYQTVIEYFGIRGDNNYDNGTKRKKILYLQNHFNLIPVYPETLKKDYQTYILKSLHNYQKNKLIDLERRIGSGFYK